jgi:hypothetical protein
MPTETMPKSKKLTDTMRAVLVRIAALPSDTALEHTWCDGWRYVRTITPGTPREWPHREWLGFAATGTVEALERRGLIEVKYPRTTPGLSVTTAFLTDAGREAMSVATPEPRAR